MGVLAGEAERRVYLINKVNPVRDMADTTGTHDVGGGGGLRQERSGYKFLGSRGRHELAWAYTVWFPHTHNNPRVF